MKVALTAIEVEELSESVDFYREILGLVEIRRIKPQEGIECVFLKDGDNSVIELVKNKNAVKPNTENRSPIVSIAFNVNNLDETLEALRKSKVQVLKGPIEVSDGIKLAYIKDPNGINIEFIQGFDK